MRTTRIVLPDKTSAGIADAAPRGRHEFTHLEHRPGAKRREARMAGACRV